MHLVLSLAGGAFQSLARVSVGALAVALTLHVLKVAAEARSWHTIVRHAYPRAEITFGTTLGSFSGAIGANAILPARIGEALRLGIMRRRVPSSSTTTIATTIVLESAVEMIFGVAVVAIVLVAGRSPATAGTALAGLWPPSGLTVGLGVAGAAVAILVAVACRPRLRLLGRKMAQGASILRSPRVLVCGVLGWKLVAWALRLAAVYCFLVAFHLHAGFWAVLLVVATQSAVAVLPISPGNAGTQQAAFLVVLTGTGSLGAVLGFGVGMQAALMIVDLVIGGLALWFVAPRAGLARFFGRLRRFGRTSPSGGLQAARQAIRS